MPPLVDHRRWGTRRVTPTLQQRPSHTAVTATNRQKGLGVRQRTDQKRSGL